MRRLNTLDGKRITFSTKKKLFVVRIGILFLLLSVFVLGTYSALSVQPRKAHAASATDEVYPAVITEFPASNTYSFLEGITTGPDHNLWFAEYSSGKIGRATPSGAVTEFPLPSGTTPNGIISGPDGNLWFTEHLGKHIGRITPAGSITEFPYGDFTSGDINSITVGSDGNLWFTTGDEAIERITPQGVITDFHVPGAFIDPTTITTGLDGKLWFTSESHIGNITPGGTFTEFSLDSEYAFAGGIARGADGNLWFTEQSVNGNAIGRITPQGAITDFALPSITYPDRTTWPVTANDLTLGPDGNLWFSSDAVAVGRITPSGNVTYFLPKNASSFGGIEPEGITAGPDGNIWFTDNAGTKLGYLALGGGAGNPPPPPSTPTPTPSTRPPLPEFLLASNAAYGLDEDTLVAPSGMTVLVRSDYINLSWRSDGFEAVAFQDGAGNILIANEGTVPGITTAYQRNGLYADTAIGKDETPQALRDAISFAERVQQDYGKPLYVTGHSLGGIEAQAQARALQARCAGGATFGASGLPGNTVSGGPEALINYVDYGDPVGNYASDTIALLHDHTVGVMYHYGQVEMTGDTANASNLLNAVAAREAQLSFPYYFYNDRGPIASDEGALTIGLNLGIAIQYHSRIHYASDLNIALTPLPTVAPALSLDEFMTMYGGPIGEGGTRNAEAMTVSTSGTVVSPDMTITSTQEADRVTIDEIAPVKEAWGTLAARGVTRLFFDPQTGLMTGVTYESPDSAVYTVKLNNSSEVTVVQVNESTGGSYQITYDTADSQPWSSFTRFYAAANEKGGVTQAVYNWKAGGSQVRLFTHLPAGKTEKIEEFSEPNGRGKLLSTQLK